MKEKDFMLRMKKTIAFLLALIMLFSATPLDVLAETMSGILDTRSFVDAVLMRSGGGYEVTFDFADGGATQPIIIEGVPFNTERRELMTEHNVPTNPTREGYEFRGWVPSNVNYIQSDTTYTAVWSSKNKYTLTVYYLFKEDNKVASDPIIMTYPINEAYSFESPTTVVGYYPERNIVSGVAGDAAWLGKTNKQEIVYYLPSSSTAYQIKYLLEGMDGQYTVKETVDGEAMTGTYVEAEPKTYTGFTIKPDQVLRAKVAPSGDTVIEVRYTRNRYSITYDSKGGTYVEPVGYQFEQPVTAPAENPTRTGYQFAGWYDVKTDQQYTFHTMPAEDVQLYAKWTPLTDSYTVVYWLEDANAPRDASGAPTKYNFYSSTVVNNATVGTTVTANTAPVKRVNNIAISQYHHSDSAVVSGDGSTVVNVYSKLIDFTYTFDLSKVTSGHTYYGQMTFGGQTYTGTQYSFKARYGENIAAKWPVAPDAAFKLVDNYQYELTSHKFYGWSRGNNTSTWVTKRISITDDMLPASGTVITLNALWESRIRQRSVNYYLEALNHETPDLYDYSGRNYVRSGEYSQDFYSTVNNWGQVSGLSPKSIYGMVAMETTASTDDVVNFHYNRVRNRLAFDTLGGPNTPASVPDVRYGERLSSYKPNYEGTTYVKDGVTYVFDGWYYQAECRDKVYPNDIMPAENLTLFAKWAAPVHTVHFYKEPGDAQPYATVQVPHGKSVQDVFNDHPSSAFNTPENPGYDFVTWRYVGSGASYTLGTAVQQDLNVYAQWKMNNNVSYRVEYINVEDGAPMPGLEPVVRTGFHVGQSITEASPRVSGYLVDSPLKTLTLKGEDNLIQFKYKKQKPYGYDIIGRRSDLDNMQIYQEHVDGNENEYYVTVNAPDIPGYVPQAPATLSRQLSYESDMNKFVFYYLPSDLYANYKVEYYLENPNDFSGGTYIHLQDEAKGGQIGLQVTAEDKNFPGYELDPIHSVSTGTIIRNDEGEQLVLQMYYTLKRGDATVEKVWVDEADSSRRGPVEVTLTNSAYAGDGQFNKKAILNEDNNYRVTMHDVHVWDATVNQQTKEVTAKRVVLTVKESKLGEETVGAAGSNLLYYTYTSGESKQWDGDSTTLRVTNTLRAADYTVHHYLVGTTTKVAEDQRGQRDIGSTFTLTPATQGGTPALLSGYETARPLGTNPAQMTIQAGQNVATLYYQLPISVTVTKTWVNGPAGDHTLSNTKLNLYRQSAKPGSAEETVSATPVSQPSGGAQIDQFTYTWSGLSPYDSEGYLYTYRVKEDNVTDNRVKIGDNVYSVTGHPATDGGNITNTYVVPKTADIVATKSWAGTIANETARPEIYFQLQRSLNGGEKQNVGSPVKVVNDRVNFGPQDKTDIHGALYTYTVQEVDSAGNSYTPANYKKTEQALNVTNTVLTADSDLGVLTIKKSLLANGSGVYGGTAGGGAAGAGALTFDFTVTGPYGYTTTFSLAPGQNKALHGLFFGEYTVKETNASGYTAAYSTAGGKITLSPANRLGTVEVTNTNGAPATLQTITVTKQWENGPQGDHELGSITMKLYRQSAKSGSTKEEVNAKPETGGAQSAFTYMWKNLAKHDPYGYAYTYTVEETHTDGKVTVNGHTYAVSGSPANDGGTIKNSYQPPERTFSAVKQWKDGPQNDHVAVPVQLWRSVGGVEEKVNDTAATDANGSTATGKWIYTWTHLDQTDKNGVDYTYFIRETSAVNGKVTTASGNEYAVTSGEVGGVYTITNTYVPPINGFFTAVKNWVDGPENDHTAIPLELYRQVGSGAKEKVEDFEPAKVSATGTAGSFTYTWSSLPEKDRQGNAYTYSVAEPGVSADGKVTVNGRTYAVVQSGNTITNTYQIPRTGKYTATKQWSGDETVTRPAMIFTLWRKAGTVDEAVPNTEPREVGGSVTSAEWTNLATTTAAGEAYTFYVKEAFKDAASPLNDNWKLGEFSADSITNSVIPAKEKVGKLTVTKLPLVLGLTLKKAPAAMNGEAGEEDAPAPAVSPRALGDPIKFSFKVTGPYGYEQTFKLAPNESKELTGLYFGEYTVTETDTKGYAVSYSPSAGKVTLTRDSAEGTVKVTNANYGQDPALLVEPTITKNWVNGSKPVTRIQLWREGIAADGTTPINEIMDEYQFTATDTTHTFTGSRLFKHDPTGREYRYYASEPIVPDNYTKQENGLTVTNTYTSPVSERTITKVWNNVPAGGVVSGTHLTLERTVDGWATIDKVGTYAVEGGTATNGTLTKTQTISNLPTHNQDGRAYTYRVRETDAQGASFVPKGYQKVESGLTVTNTYNGLSENGEDQPAQVRLAISKVWQGMELGRTLPSVTVTLHREPGTETVTKTFAPAKGNLQGALFTFETTDDTRIVRYAPDGTAYTYWAEETAVNGYTTLYVPDTKAVKEGAALTITNTYQPETVQRTIIKARMDGTVSPVAPLADDKAVPALTVKLYYMDNARRIDVGSYTFPAADAWGSAEKEHTFTVPRYDTTGGEITCLVEETDGSGWQLDSQTQWADGKKTLTNIYTGGDKVSRTMVKKAVFPEGLSLAGVTLPEITLELVRNGQKMGEAYRRTVRMTAQAEGVEAVITGLLQYDTDGTAFTYTADEVSIPNGYKKTVEGLTVTNTYDGVSENNTENPVTVNVDKAWANTAEKTALKATYTIKRDGGDFALPDGQTAAITKEQTVEDGKTAIDHDGVFEAAWTNLLRFKPDAMPYVYTVVESGATTGYVQKPVNPVTQDADGVYRLTNTYTPDTRTVTVEKVWESSLGMAEIAGKSLPTVTLALQRREANQPNTSYVAVHQNGAALTHAFAGSVPAGQTAPYGQSHTFTNLEATAPSGQPYVYRAVENAVPSGYRMEQRDDTTVANIYDGMSDDDPNTPTDRMGPMTVKKEWGNLASGLMRPNTYIYLYREDRTDIIAYTHIMARVENGVPDTFEFNSTNVPAELFLRYKPNGETYHYTVKEGDVFKNPMKGYTPSYAPENREILENGTVTITNTWDDAKTNYVITKLWQDQNGVPLPKGTKVPALKLTISEADHETGQPDGAPVHEHTIPAGEIPGSAIKHTFTVPTYTTEGDALLYMVQETVPSGYTAVQSDIILSNKQATLTNRYTGMNPDGTGISVTLTKAWTNLPDGFTDASQLPSVRLQLMQNGEAMPDKVKEVSASAIANGKATAEVEFADLPVYDMEGNPFVYTAEEVAADGAPTGLDGYKKTISDKTVTNAYDGKTDANDEDQSVTVHASKVWLGENDAVLTENLPAKAVLVLKRYNASGAEDASFAANKQDAPGTAGFKTEWTDLQKYAPDGSVYQYKVEEARADIPNGYRQVQSAGTAVEGTLVTGAGTQDAPYIVTNKYDGVTSNDGTTPGGAFDISLTNITRLIFGKNQFPDLTYTLTRRYGEGSGWSAWAPVDGASTVQNSALGFTGGNNTGYFRGDGLWTEQKRFATNGTEYEYSVNTSLGEQPVLHNGADKVFEEPLPDFACQYNYDAVTPEGHGGWDKDGKRVVVRHIPQQGVLRLTKKYILDGQETAGGPFTYTITGGASMIPDMHDQLVVHKGSTATPVAIGTGSFTMNAGETVYISGIRHDSTLTVREQNAHHYTMSATFSKVNAAGLAGAGLDKDTGVISVPFVASNFDTEIDLQANVTLLNEQRTLTVKKTFIDKNYNEIAWPKDENSNPIGISFTAWRGYDNFPGTLSNATSTVTLRVPYGEYTFTEDTIIPEEEYANYIIAKDLSAAIAEGDLTEDKWITGNNPLVITKDSPAHPAVRIVNMYRAEVQDQFVVKKNWVNGGDDAVRPKLYFKLVQYTDGVKNDQFVSTLLPVPSSNGGTAAWSDVPRTSTSGGNIVHHTYEVEEVDSAGKPYTPNGYTESFVPGKGTSAQDAYTYTNTYDGTTNYEDPGEPQTISISVSKAWTNLVLNHKFNPPTAQLKLYRTYAGRTEAVKDIAIPFSGAAEETYTENGIQYQRTTLAAETVTGLEKFAPDGNPYVYSVDEPNVPMGYIKTVAALDDGDGNVDTLSFLVTNRFEQGAHESVSGNINFIKEWRDIPAGTAAKGLLPSATVKLVDVTDGTAKDLTPDAYTSATGLTYGDVRKVTAVKDGTSTVPDQDTANVYTRYVKLSRLARYRADGKEYKFKLLELPINGYKTDIDESTHTEGGVVNQYKLFINTYTPTENTVSITARKLWEMRDAPKGAKGATITMQLWRRAKDASGQNTPYWQVLQGTDETDINMSVGGGDKTLVDASTDGAHIASATWENLPKYAPNGSEYEYEVREVPVNGYARKVTPPSDTETAWRFANIYDGITSYDDPTKPVEKPVTLKVNKNWTDVPAGGTVPQATVHIYNDSGAEVSTLTFGGTAALTEAKTVTGIKRYAPDGHEYAFHAVEDSVAGYIQHNAPAEGKYLFTGDETTITNKFSGETVSFTATKVWEGVDSDAAVPDISVELKQTLGSGAGAVVRTLGAPALVQSGTAGAEEAQRSKTWSGLPRYAADGREYAYDADEVSVPVGYEKTSVVTENGKTVMTNRYNPAKYPVSVTKTWKLPDNAAYQTVPGVTISLMRDGVLLASQSDIKPSAAGTTQQTLTFDAVPLYKTDGSRYVYTVEETNRINGYRVTISPVMTDTASNKLAAEVVNEYTGIHPDGAKTLRATKKWDKIPENAGSGADVVLSVERKTGDKGAFADYVAAGTKPAAYSAFGSASVLWSGLLYYEIDGSEFFYRPAEKDVPNGYVSELTGSGTEEAPYVITNTYDGITGHGDNPTGAINFTAQKVWTNTGDAAGAAVTLLLKQTRGTGTGAVTATVGSQRVTDVNAAQDESSATYTWQELKRYAPDGTAYTYWVDEETEPSGYTKTLTDAHTVTNAYSGGDTRTISLSKVWAGSVAVDDNVPQVSFKLVRRTQSDAAFALVPGAAEKVLSGTASVLAALNVGDWEGMPTYAPNGEKYIYSVEEYVAGAKVPYNEPGNKVLPNFTFTAAWDDATGKVTATNTFSQSSLIISKKLYLNEVETAGQPFTFTIKGVAADGDGKVKANGVLYPASEFTVTVNSGSTLTIEGFKQGSEVSVTENEGAYYHTIPEGPTWKATFPTDIGAVTETRLNVENHGVAELRIDKYFRNAVGDRLPAPDGVTDVTVTVTGKNSGYTNTVKVPANGSLILEGLPYDIYTVTETPVAGYRPVAKAKRLAEPWTQEELAVESASAEAVLSSEQETAGVRIANIFLVKKDAEAKATKVWSGGEGERPTVWLKLYRQALSAVEDVSGAPIKRLLNSETEATWTNLESTDISGNAYTFSVREVDENGNPFTPNGYTKEENGLTVTNIYDGLTNNDGPSDPFKDYVSVTAEKKWAGTEGRNGADAQLSLKRNDRTEPLDTVTMQDRGAHHATYTWERQLKYAPDSTEYVYTVEETTIPNGYYMSRVGNVFTNTYDGTSDHTDPNEPKKQKSYTVHKVWKELPGSAVGASVQVQLVIVPSGRAYGDPVRLNDTAAGHSHLFEHLPYFGIDGKEQFYNAVEVKVPNGYTSESVQAADKQSTTITNTYDGVTNNEDPENPKQETLSISAVKKWKDTGADNGAPVTLKLMLKGQQVQEGQKLEDNGSHTATANWKELKKYSPSGTAYKADRGFWGNIPLSDYVVREESVPNGYTVKYAKAYAVQLIPGLYIANLTNTYDGKTNNNDPDYPIDEKASISVTVSKTWANLPANAAGADAPVTLLRNGMAVGSATLKDSEGQKTHTFTGLDRYDKQGNAYTYTVKETVPNGYKVSGEALVSEGLVTVDGEKVYKYKADLVNTYDGITNNTDPNDPKEEYVLLNSRKIWENTGDETGATVWMQLYRNGVQIDEKEFVDDGSHTADGNPGYVTKRLKYAPDGSTYRYSVGEKDVPNGYTVKVDGFTVTNTYDGKTNNTDHDTPTPETVTIKAIKKWDNVKAGDPLPTISVQLMRNGKTYLAAQTLAPGETTAEWKDLLKFAPDSTPYVYMVSEVSIPKGYQMAQTREGDTFTITNTYDGISEGGTPKTPPTPDNPGSNPTDPGVQSPVTIAAQKLWDVPENTRGAQVTLLLKLNDKTVGEEKTLTDNGTHRAAAQWEGLKKYRTDGTSYNILTAPADYRVVESPVPNGYVLSGSDTLTEWSAVANGYMAMLVNTYDGKTQNDDPEHPSGEKATLSVTVSKTWQNISGNETVAPVPVQLLRNGEVLKNTTLRYTESGASYVFSGLDRYDVAGNAYTYTVKETVPNGYKGVVGALTPDGSDTVDGEKVYKYKSDIVNTYDGTTNNDDPNDVKTETVSMTATKTWEHVPAGAATPAVSIRLLRNGLKLGEDKVVEPGVGNRTISIQMGSDMPKYSQDGKPYVYTVIEVNVPKGYAYKQVGTAITNTYDGISEGGTPVQPPIDPDKPFDPDLPGNNAPDPDPDKQWGVVTATKAWDNVTDITRVPAISVHLKRDGKVVGEETIQGNGTATWDMLLKYKPDSTPYIYTVSEAAIPKGYRMTQTRVGNAVTITNTYDGISEGGTPIEPPIDPDKPFDPNDPGNNPTDPNNKNPRTVIATKKWENVTDIEKVPEISVRLLRGGEDLNMNKPIKGNGTATWEGLLRYAEDSTPFVYTVMEAEVPKGYAYKQEGFTLTNTYDGISEGGTPEKPEGPADPNNNPVDPDPNKVPRSVTATKEWKNVTDVSKVPAISVRILRNGEDQHKDQSIQGNGSVTWEGLYKYSEDSKPYIYTVAEVEIPKGYTYKQEGYKLTNTYDGISEGGRPVDPVNPVDPDKPFDPNDPGNNPTDPNNKKPVIITATKEWKNVTDMTRVPEISVRIMRNGEDLDKNQSIQGNGSVTWKDLPRYSEDSRPYIYTVAEVMVPKGYAYTQRGYTLTNTYDGVSEGGEPKKPQNPIDPTKPFDPNAPANNPADPDPNKVPRTVTVSKEWRNVTDIEKVPAIAVRIMRNGDAFGQDEKTIMPGESTATWQGLLKYSEDSKPYIYTVSEVEIPKGYSYKQEGYKLINTYDGVSEGGKPVDPVNPLGPDTPNTPDNPFDPNDPGNNPTDPNKKTPITITATKEWKNVTDITKVPEIAVRLLRNGADQNRNQSIQGNGSVTWNNLPKYAEDSKAYIYTVLEASVPAGYAYTQKGYTLTNTYDGISDGGVPVQPPIDPDKPFDPEDPANNPADPDPNKTPRTVAATKQWKNVPEGAKVPDIAVMLKRDGTAFGEAKPIKSGESTATWEGLIKYAEDSRAYIYTVSEVDIPKGFFYEQKGYTLTNTYDGISEGGKPVDPKDPVTPDTPNTPDNPFDPEKPDNNPTDPNKKSPITVKATKQWKNVPAGAKVPDIAVMLKRDGQPTGSEKTIRSGESTVEWTGLYKYSVEGAIYIYTVSEVSIPRGYAYEQKGYMLTNTYDGISEGGKPVDPKDPVTPNTPGTPNAFDPEVPDNNPTDPGIKRPVTVQAEKKWRNMGGLRTVPEIMIGLKQSGVEFGTPLTLKPGEKTVEWKDLLRFAPDASEYEYTVYEVDVPFGYTMSIDGNVIINRRLDEHEIPIDMGIIRNVGECFE